MKKIISLLLALALAVCGTLCLFACEPQKDDAEIRVGYMAGPTGIGMAKLIHDADTDEANYSFTKYADTTSANTDLMTGHLDIACLPTNEAAKYYNQANSDMQVLAINCLNSLYILTNDSVEINSIEDLEGKTVYTCKNGTPRIILEKLLAECGVNATVSYQIGEGDTALTINTPQDIPPVIIANKADIILAPEPIVSNALSKPAAVHEVALDLGKSWDEAFDTPIAMGCIVVSKAFAEAHPLAIKDFLAAYEASINYIALDENLDSAAEYVVETGIMAEVAAAKTAITNLGDAITYIDGADMKAALVGIYNVFGLNVIGGKLPDDGFYYEK